MIIALGRVICESIRKFIYYLDYLGKELEKENNEYFRINK